MTRKPTRPSGGKTVLSDEDHELWAHTTRSLKPLKRAKSRIHPAAEAENDKPHAVFAPKSAQGKAHTHAAPAHGGKDGKGSAAARKTAAEIGPFDPRTARKLRRGHLEIEARIDLHGLRQAEAHAALSRFLISAAAQGKRWVLVITGKGAPARTPEDERRRPFDEPVRGILKRSVPMWLAEPDLRPLVVSFREAAIAHGGSGAIYVHLRRRAREPD